MYPPSRSMLRRLVAWGSSVLPPSMMPADGAQRTYVLNFRELLRDELPKTPYRRSSQNSPSRDCLKKHRNKVVAYAPVHEKELPHQPYRCRMALPQVPPPNPEKTRTTENPRLSRDP